MSGSVRSLALELTEQKPLKSAVESSYWTSRAVTVRLSFAFLIFPSFENSNGVRKSMLCKSEEGTWGESKQAGKIWGSEKIGYSF